MKRYRHWVRGPGLDDSGSTDDLAEARAYVRAKVFTLLASARREWTVGIDDTKGSQDESRWTEVYRADSQSESTSGHDAPTHHMVGLRVRVITEDGELIRELTLDPSRDYQPHGRS